MLLLRLDIAQPLSSVAETDGNRTRQAEMLGLTGFEDRGAHQDTYASARGVYQRRSRAPGAG